MSGIRLELPSADRQGIPIGEFPMPSNDRGQFFPGRIGGTSNGGAVELLRDSVGLLSRESTPVTGDFTIELFTHIDELVVGGNTLGADLAGQITKVGTPRDMSWSIKVWMNISQVKSQELAFVLSDGSDLHWPPSNISIDAQKDYYIAGVFDLEGQEITYYAYDLENDSLEISPSPHSLTQLNGDATMTIGGDSCQCFFTDGVIDEVRLSDGALDFENLLLGETDLIPSEVILHPQALSSRSENTGSVTNRRRTDGSWLAEGDDLTTKFELSIVDANPFETLRTAELSFLVDGTGQTNLELLSSLEDNILDSNLDTSADQSYSFIEQQDILFDPSAEAEVVFDVTQLLYSHQQLSGDDVLAFRLVNGAGMQKIEKPRLELTFGSPRDSLVGDINGNGTVDFADFLVLSSNFGTTGGFQQGDLDANGEIDFADFLILSENFGEASEIASTVPEPEGALSLLIVLVCLLASKRIRRDR